MKSYIKEVLDYDCTSCRLHKDRTQVVWGSGNPLSELCFVGEGPGEDEDLEGEAFVGRSGKLLTLLLKMLKLPRDEVLILNLIKCRPPKNRNPYKDEIKACNYWFRRQLMEAPNIKVIVCLGRVAWNALTGRVGEPLHVYHGTNKKIGKYWFLYAYHPSYLLRNTDTQLRKNFLRDVRKAKLLLTS